MSDISREQGVTIVQVDPDYDSLDEWRIRRFREELLAAVDSADPPLLIVDLSRTSFVGSSFIGVLIRAWKRICVRKGRMAICGATNVSLEALHVSKLDTLWSIYPTRDEALQGLLSAVS